MEKHALKTTETQDVPDAGGTGAAKNAGIEPEIRKADMSIRIPPERWLDETMLAQILDMLDSNPGVAEELALFTSFTHPPLPLQVARRRAAIMAERIAMIRKRSYGCGINVLATMGHHSENLDHSLQGDFARRMDEEGRICHGSFCPNDRRFVEEYVIPLYAAMAQAGPDFIWIDDDVRSGHWPIGLDCFCDCCLERFADQCGTSYSRVELAAKLNAGSKRERRAFRGQWLQAKRDTINRLFRAIENTVHAINPGIVLGFMTGERYADGYDFGTQAEILAGPRNQKVLWRPGGGFYTDATPGEMAEKSHDIGRQIALLPEWVRSIQSEIENFGYEALGKSVHINAAEVACHIAAGCTGAALNVMGLSEDLSVEKTGLFRELSAQRPFYDALVRAQGRIPAMGIFTGWNKDTQVVNDLSRADDVHATAYVPNFANPWFELGLPMAYHAGSAQMAMFCGDAPYAFSQEELLGWLRKGIYMDAGALEAFNELGYDALTGFTAREYLHADCIERLGAHPLNGDHSGYTRDNRQSFTKGLCAVLEPSSGGAQSLAQAVDYEGDVRAECVMGIFENRLGGRVCVSGYYPWDFVQTHAKSAQCRNIVRWLTRDRIPAYVCSLHKANLWVREDAAGRKILTLLTASMDAAQGLRLCVLTGSETLRITDKSMRTAPVPSSDIGGGYRMFTLPRLDPWSVYLAVAP